MTSYHSSQTIAYKQGYIHISIVDGVEVVQAQIGYKLKNCKTVKSAKAYITRKA